MREPLVSVVIPTYNRASAVVRALDTVFMQGYENIQAIVVDDASTDDTETRVRRAYDGRVHYVRNDVRSGPGAARNRGAELAEGSYVAFLDSDDQWLDGKLRRQVVLATGGSDVVYGTALHFDLAGRVVFVQRARTRGDVRRPLIGRNIVAGSASSVLVRRSCLEAVGGFRTDLYSEDWELWQRLAFRCRFDFVPEPLVKIRIDPSGRQRTAPPHALAVSLEEMYRALLDDPLSAEFARRHRVSYRAAIEYYVGVQHCRFGEVAQGIRRLFRSIAAKPLQARAYVQLTSLAMGQGVVQR